MDYPPPKMTRTYDVLDFYGPVPRRESYETLTQQRQREYNTKNRGGMFLEEYNYYYYVITSENKIVRLLHPIV